MHPDAALRWIDRSNQCRQCCVTVIIHWWAPQVWVTFQRLQRWATAICLPWVIHECSANSHLNTDAFDLPARPRDSEFIHWGEPWAGLGSWAVACRPDPCPGRPRIQAGLWEFVKKKWDKCMGQFFMGIVWLGIVSWVYETHGQKCGLVGINYLYKYWLIIANFTMDIAKAPNYHRHNLLLDLKVVLLQILSPWGHVHELVW